MKTIGKYQLLDQIGTSAAGTTHRARDAFRNKELAVKIIRDVSPLSAPLKERLYTELVTCAELSNHHIRKVHDLGEVDGQVYIASELLTGVDLLTFLAGQSTLVGQKLSVVAQVCEALAFAHGKGIAHGNLKPTNILVADGSYATVLDFGIGTWQTSMLAAGARLEGLLPKYLAPEQVLGEPFDARSDVFSAALILYEILTGKYPFQVADGLIPRELVHSDPEPLRTLDPLMPEELEQLLVRALDKNPERRLQTADEFAATLYTIARRFRREQPAPALFDAVVERPAAPVSERAQASDKDTAKKNPAEKKAESRKIAATQDTALQPWTARSYVAQSGREAASGTPAREEPVQTQPGPVLPQPTAAPIPRAPAPVPAVLPPTPPPASLAGARLESRPSPMPQRFQRTGPPRISRKLRIRILTAAAGALIGVWLVGSFVSRQSLRATQTKAPVDSVGVAPKTPGREVESRLKAESVTAPDTEPRKPVEQETKEPSASQILRFRVKPLWEAGKYSEAMEEVNQALAADPGSAEARIWKKRILAAQDAEAAVK
ncbi:MAG: serine/threonine-protein kinase [Bryobacteraceae bacterium]